jgi:anti-sigma factor RsiW
MTCHECHLDLGDYVDRNVTADTAAAVEAHLAGCASCRALLADFRTLQGVASSLERRNPPPHVWTNVAAALVEEQARHPWWNPFAGPFIGWRPLLASGIILALVSGATWFSWREAATVQSTRVAETTTVTEVALHPNLEAAQVLRSEIVQLEGIVNAGAEVLPGETKAAYQVSDAVIEQAIGQSRAALATEPSNDLAQQSLFEALRSKLALLQDMVALINEMRKGNQEGAARIVSGMEQ